MANIVTISRVRMGRLVLFTLAALILAWPRAANAEQTSFASTQEGFASLVTALKGNDVQALKDILGPDGYDLLYSGDNGADADARKLFIDAYTMRYAVNMLDDTHASLSIGKDDWEFPIPMSRTGGRWRFDTATGKQELINRRIGRNELAAIQACLAYVEAQLDFAARTRAVGAIPYYSVRFVSSRGNRDGLYWPAGAGETPSPLGPLFGSAQLTAFAAAPEPGTPPGPTKPYFGYVYKILTAQGPAANGGRLSYVVNGEMIGGFALVAAPVRYGFSGVMTFIVNHEGKVYQRDLGPNTTSIARAMTAFNPDAGWIVVR